MTVEILQFINLWYENQEFGRVMAVTRETSRFGEGAVAECFKILEWMYTGHQTRTQCRVPAHVIFLVQCSTACLVSVSHMRNTCMCLKSQRIVVLIKTFVFTLCAAWHTVHLL